MEVDAHATQVPISKRDVKALGVGYFYTFTAHHTNNHFQLNLNLISTRSTIVNFTIINHSTKSKLIFFPKSLRFYFFYLYLFSALTKTSLNFHKHKTLAFSLSLSLVTIFTGINLFVYSILSLCLYAGVIVFVRNLFFVDRIVCLPAQIHTKFSNCDV